MVESTNQTNSDQEDDFCVGSILGAFIGDSAGSLLEFVPGKHSKALVKKAMTMSGGGHHKVAAG